MVLLEIWCNRMERTMYEPQQHKNRSTDKHHVEEICAHRQPSQPRVPAWYKGSRRRETLPDSAAAFTPRAETRDTTASRVVGISGRSLRSGVSGSVSVRANVAAASAA